MDEPTTPPPAEAPAEAQVDTAAAHVEATPESAAPANSPEKGDSPESPATVAENPNGEGQAPGAGPVSRSYPPEIVELADLMKRPPEEIDPRAVLDFIHTLLEKQTYTTPEDAAGHLEKLRKALEHIERAASNGHGPSQEFLRSL